MYQSDINHFKGMCPGSMELGRQMIYIYISYILLVSILLSLQPPSHIFMSSEKYT